LTADTPARFDNRAQYDYHTPGMIVFYWSAPAASGANNAIRRSPFHIHTLNDVGGRSSAACHFPPLLSEACRRRRRRCCATAALIRNHDDGVREP